MEVCGQKRRSRRFRSPKSFISVFDNRKAASLKATPTFRHPVVPDWPKQAGLHRNDLATPPCSTQNVHVSLDWCIQTVTPPGSASPTLCSNHIVCIETSSDTEVNNHVFTKTQNKINSAPIEIKDFTTTSILLCTRSDWTKKDQSHPCPCNSARLCFT